MMNKKGLKETWKQFIIVMAGNILQMLSKLIVWLVIPKLLGVEEYGYYKIFTLYLTYAAFLHFGFPDGILLLFAGKQYLEVNRGKFKTFSQFFIAFQCTVSICIVFLGITVLNAEAKFLLIVLGIDSFFINVATYYKFISQAVMRFHELTIRNIIQAVFQVISLCLLYILLKINIHISGGKIYILFIVAIDGILCIWYMVTYSALTFGRGEKLSDCIHEIINIFKNGILLTIAYQLSHLIFVLDSQMVSVLFNINIYSVYAFAYSVINFITIAINAMAIVLFPNLKRLDKENAIEKFEKLMAYVTGISSFLLLGYFPINLIVRTFLTEYNESIYYLRIILPGFVVTCCINMIIFTYYKILNHINIFVCISMGMLTLGLVLNCAGYFWIAPKPEVFSVLSILILICWYLVSELYLVKRYHIGWKKNCIYMLMLINVFYCVVEVLEDSIIFAGGIYLILYILITALFYGKSFLRVWKAGKA